MYAGEVPRSEYYEEEQLPHVTEKSLVSLYGAATSLLRGSQVAALLLWLALDACVMKAWAVLVGVLALITGAALGTWTSQRTLFVDGGGSRDDGPCACREAVFLCSAKVRVFCAFLVMLAVMAQLGSGYCVTSHTSLFLETDATLSLAEQSDAKDEYNSLVSSKPRTLESKDGTIHRRYSQIRSTSQTDPSLCKLILPLLRSASATACRRRTTLSRLSTTSWSKIGVGARV